MFMKTVDEHSKHTLDCYNIEGRDIHTWIDEPCKLFGPSHRRVRHDVEGLKDAIKVFSNKYSEIEITKVYVDHVLADIASEPHKNTHQRKGDVENDRLRKALKREFQLSTMRTNRIRNYLRIAFLNDPKKVRQFNNAYYALTDWEKFYLSRENPSTALTSKEIGDYALNLRSRALKPKTASNYLHYLSGYFTSNNEEQFYVTSMKYYKDFVGEFRKEKNCIPIRHIWNMYKHAEVTDQVLFRLLIFENIPIQMLETVKFYKTVHGIYRFTYLQQGEEKSVEINEETVKIAEPLLKSNLEKKTDLFLPFGKRTIIEHVENIRKQLGIEEEISPQDIRNFGERQNRAEMLELFRGNALWGFPEESK